MAWQKSLPKYQILFFLLHFVHWLISRLFFGYSLLVFSVVFLLLLYFLLFFLHQSRVKSKEIVRTFKYHINQVSFKNSPILFTQKENQGYLFTELICKYIKFLFQLKSLDFFLFIL